MSDSIHLIPAAAQREWGRWLEPIPHDFYHTAAYHRFSEESGEGEAFLAVYGHGERYLVWPYLLRRLGESELRDVTSVYGYPGPLARGCSAGDPFLERAWRSIAELWRSQNVITAFTRFHPLLENERWINGTVASPAAAIRPGGATVSIDLSLGEATNWHDYQASLRNRINRGRRLGLVTEPDESWAFLEDFARFYQAAMERNHASPWYFFSVDYFRRLKRALGPRAFLMVTRAGSEIAAAGIFVEYGGIVANHFSMNNKAWLGYSPSKILLDDVRRWAQARGNRVFHLGGGRGGCEDSLFYFKAAFSRRRHPFHAGRWVLDSHVYRQLCEGLPHPAGDFFPGYRAPLGRPEESAVETTAVR